MDRRSALSSVASFLALGTLASASSRARAEAGESHHDKAASHGGHDEQKEHQEHQEHDAAPPRKEEAAPAAAPPSDRLAFPIDHAGDVRVLLLKQAEEWSAGDLGAFCARYSDTCMFFSPSGVTIGRHELFSRYRKKYPSGAEMGTLTVDVLDMRASGRVASAALQWTLTWENRAPAERTARGHSVVTLERDRDGAWRIVFDASM